MVGRNGALRKRMRPAEGRSRLLSLPFAVRDLCVFSIVGADANQRASAARALVADALARLQVFSRGRHAGLQAN